MEVSSIAAAASANALGRVQAEASLMVLKKAMDLQSQSA
ncbi:putative motility protein, partial [Thauera sp. ZXT1-4]